MQGDAEVLQLLNEQLTSELTSINQYFLHSKMQDNWGFTELAAHTRAESFEEMRHAETLTDRILLLDGAGRHAEAETDVHLSPRGPRWPGKDQGHRGVAIQLAKVRMTVRYRLRARANGRGRRCKGTPRS